MAKHIIYPTMRTFSNGSTYYESHFHNLHSNSSQISTLIVIWSEDRMSKVSWTCCPGFFSDFHAPGKDCALAFLQCSYVVRNSSFTGVIVRIPAFLIRKATWRPRRLQWLHEKLRQIRVGVHIGSVPLLSSLVLSIYMFARMIPLMFHRLLLALHSPAKIHNTPKERIEVGKYRKIGNKCGKTNMN